MVKYDLFWMSNRDWLDISTEYGCRLKESAPEEAKRSYEIYLTQKRRADERTTRLFVIPKTREGAEYYETEGLSFEDENDCELPKSYENDKMIVFCIPYNEFCILRSYIEIEDYFEADTYRLSARSIKKYLAEIERLKLDTPMVIDVLKRAVEYNTYTEFLESRL